MTTPAVVVVGSVNMDLVVKCARLPRPGETIIGRDFRCLPGGKGANQVVAAARLGAAVEFIGCVGIDAFGDQAVAALREEGIGIDHLRRVEGVATGVAIISVADSGENSIAVAPGANHVLSMRDIDAARERIAAGALLVCQLETPLVAVHRAIEIAAAARVPVLLNPAPAQPLSDALLSMVDLLVPNEGEAVVLAGIGGNPASARYAISSTTKNTAAATVHLA